MCECKDVSKISQYNSKNIEETVMLSALIFGSRWKLKSQPSVKENRQLSKSNVNLYNSLAYVRETSKTLKFI